VREMDGSPVWKKWPVLLRRLSKLPQILASEKQNVDGCSLEFFSRTMQDLANYRKVLADVKVKADTRGLKLKSVAATAVSSAPAAPVHR